ncbi:MAG: hypothetical protein H6573_31310 [Lewinellaceae bacterium]|nr:hypothetical protein [Lewinellaceae bacterium]
MLGTNRKWGYSQLRFSTFNQTLGLAEGEQDANGHFLMDAAPFQKITTKRWDGIMPLFSIKYSLKTVLGYQKPAPEFTAPDEPRPVL